MNNQDNKLFYARLEDMHSRCERDGCAVFSSFLDETQSALAMQWCGRNIGDTRFMLWGGFDEARRKMLALYPEYCEESVRDDFPFVCLTLTFRKEDKLTHRDILGTLMGNRLKRETVGDIVIDEGIAQVFVTENVAKLITCSLSKVGRVGVKITDEKPFSLEVKQEFKDICGTVASMRLDCVAALCVSISREKAAALIRSEKVEVNHFTAVSISQELHEGDILSIRGSGRFIVFGTGNKTRKDRIHINLRKYI